MYYHVKQTGQVLSKGSQWGKGSQQEPRMAEGWISVGVGIG